MFLINPLILLMNSFFRNIFILFVVLSIFDSILHLIFLLNDGTVPTESFFLDVDLHGKFCVALDEIIPGV